ncbi:hypothetical protein [Algoriphagus sanaruensis]|uniref:hypothetical protein n=1 Tax=Algoriphagus sanaruensis TaxID=1727163 RepID=UPI000A6FC256|nr:hypothetical protein [Algoriphagus sanaruensis]
MCFFEGAKIGEKAQKALVEVGDLVLAKHQKVLWEVNSCALPASHVIDAKKWGF